MRDWRREKWKEARMKSDLSTRSLGVRGECQLAKKANPGHVWVTIGQLERVLKGIEAGEEG